MNTVKVLLSMLVIFMFGAANAQTVTITTNPTPATICVGAGTNVTMTANPAGGTVINYIWSDGSVTPSIGRSPVVTTTYTVTVNFVGGFVATANAVINVTNPPSTSVVAGGPTVICQGNSTTLSSSLIGDSYQWYESGVPLPGATNQSYAATTSGNYNVYITVGTCSAWSVNTKAVTVLPGPPATTDITAQQNPCFGHTVTLTANAGAGYTYQWLSSPTGFAPWNVIPGATTRSFTLAVSAHYRVQVTDSNGCSSVSN